MSDPRRTSSGHSEDREDGVGQADAGGVSASVPAQLSQTAPRFQGWIYRLLFPDLEDKTRNGQRPLVGAVWVVIAMFMLAGLVALGRYAALEGMDPLQVLFFRNFFCVVWMLPLLAWRGAALFRTDQLGLYGVRVGLSFIAMTGMFHAIAVLPIGEVTAIGFLAPLFGTLFAVLWLREQVGWRRWAALFVGFCGAMIILRPGLSAIGPGQAFALMSALAIGVIGPLVKTLTRKDDPDRVVFLTNLFLTPLSLVPAVFVWQTPSNDLWPWLVLMGLCAVLGHMALARGYAATEASLVMTYKFARLPFAVAIGYLAFSESIDAWSWAGGLVIFAASVYVARREASLKTQRGLGGSAGPLA